MVSCFNEIDQAELKRKIKDAVKEKDNHSFLTIEKFTSKFLRSLLGSIILGFFLDENAKDQIEFFTC